MFIDLERHGNKVAVEDEAGRSLTYVELAALADKTAAALGEDRRLVAVECANEIEVVAAYIGALRRRHAVILTGQGGATNTELARKFSPHYVFRAQADGTRAFQAFSEDPVALHPDLAVLLSTSGTTGSTKLVRLSLRNVAANAQSIARYLELSADDRSATCLPMQYSYGMSVINSTFESGGALVLTDKSLQDPAFWSLVDRRGVTNFQGVPHSYELLARSSFFSRQHASLRFFTQAGGRLAPTLVKQFAAYAQRTGTRFYVMYGQTEASPRMAWLPPQDAHDHAETIGRAIPGGELWVERDGVRAPDGEVGELVYRGPNVMMGYAKTREELAEGQGDDILKTGDLARRLPSGHYQITGRASRFSKIFGLRVGLDDVEAAVRELGCACAATGSDQKLIVAIEPGEASAKVERFIRDQFGLPQHAILVLQLERLPLNANGKPDYNALLELARKSEPAQPPAVDLLEEARRLLDSPKVEATKSFIENGGDSLSYVQFSLIVERRIGYLPENWELMPLAALEALAGRASGAAKPPRLIPADVMLRTGAILSVLVNHFIGGGIDGAAALLLALAGYNFARFQVPKIIANNGIVILRNLFFQALVPYYLTLLPVVILLWPTPLPNLLLIYNFVPYATISELPDALIIYWFIEAYVWITVLTTLGLSIPYLRNLLGRHPSLIPGALFVAIEVYRLFADGAVGSTIFDPIAVTSRFAAGWFLYESRADALKIRALFVILILAIHPLNELDHPLLILAPGMLFLLFSQGVRLPAGRIGSAVADAVTLMAASTLYIYLLQFYLMELTNRLYPEGGAPITVKLVGLFGALAMGVTVQLAIQAMRSFRARYSSARRPKAA